MTEVVTGVQVGTVRQRRAPNGGAGGRLPPVVATLPALAVGLSVTGALAAGPTLCPVALVTGVPCPGCGMTRAVLALARGDVHQAWAAHPMGAIVAVEILAAVGWWIAARANRVAPPTPRTAAAVLAITAVGLIAVWLLRAATGTLPPVG